MLFVYIFIAIEYLTVIASSDHGHDEGHEKAKYTEKYNANLNESNKWQSYLNAVSSAQDSYSEVSDLCRNCECFLNQLRSDLEPWRDYGIHEDMIESSKPLGIHYQIINHKLYRQKDCMFPGRCEGVEHFILSLIANLNDSEFIINVRDWAQIVNGDRRTNNQDNIPLPVLSFSKDLSFHKDVLYPAWSFWSGGPAITQYPTGIGRWDEMLINVPKNSPEWINKRQIAFFRGSRTSPERDPLILLSRQKPHLIDAQYTKNQAWRSLKDTLGVEPAPTIQFEEQCIYKYLLNLRGIAASFRHKHLFLCKSLVLNVDSNWIEYYYPQLKPWIHFVPISNDLSDLEPILMFLHDNDEIAKRIADNGFDFITNYLTMDSIKCYWKNLIENYGSLLRFKPKLSKNLIEIKTKYIRSFS